MRIQGPRFDDIPGNQPQITRPQGGRNVPVVDTRTTEARTAGLLRLFESGGIPQSPSLVRTLETELNRTGINPASLDRTAALRALLLHRHNLPLTEAAVTGDLERLPSITEAVATLVDNARSLILSGKLTASERQLVAMLVGDIAALYDYPASSPILSNSLVAAVDKWAYDTESLLAAIISGETDMEMVPVGITSQNVDRMLSYLLSPQPLDRFPTAARNAIEAFRDIAARLQEIVSAVDSSRPETATAVLEALMQFENRLPDILSMLMPATSSDAQVPLAVALRELFGKQFAVLQSMLEPFMLNSLSDPVTSVAHDLMGLSNRSGIMFEWHLLAWYRSGRDPARLRNLYRQDLKGILLEFTRGRGLATRSGHRRSPLDRLRAQAAEVLERIETNQLTNLLDRHLQPRSAVVELPLAGRPGSGQAKLRIIGEKGEATRKSAPREFTLSFAVETTALGLITAYLTISGKALSVTVELEDDRWVGLSDGMTDEVRNALNGHGFAVGEVIVLRAGTRQTSHERTWPGEDIIA